MVKESFITPEVKAMIGRETEPTTGFEITEHEIKRYCLAVDDLNPLYLDKEAAKKGPYGGVIAPPLFHSYAIARLTPLSELRPDGTGRGGGGLNVPLKAERRMAGGVECDFVRPIRPGDTLTSKSRIADIYERTAKDGSQVVFTINETIFTNQKGEVVAINRSTGIAR